MPSVIAKLAKMVSILIPIGKELGELAFQLYKFLYKTGSKFLKEIEKELAEFVIFVVEQYFKFAQATKSQTSAKLIHFGRWINSGVDRWQIFRTWLKEVTA